MKKIRILKLKPNEILKSVKQSGEEALVKFSEIRALDISDWTVLDKLLRK